MMTWVVVALLAASWIALWAWAKLELRQRDVRERALLQQLWEARAMAQVAEEIEALTGGGERLEIQQLPTAVWAVRVTDKSGPEKASFMSLLSALVALRQQVTAYRREGE